MEEAKQDIVNRIIAYFKGAFDELNRVTWPTKKQTQNYAIIVIGFSIFMLVFFMVLDYFFEAAIRFVI